MIILEEDWFTNFVARKISKGSDGSSGGDDSISKTQF